MGNGWAKHITSMGRDWARLGNNPAYSRKQRQAQLEKRINNGNRARSNQTPENQNVDQAQTAVSTT